MNKTRRSVLAFGLVAMVAFVCVQFASANANEGPAHTQNMFGDVPEGPGQTQIIFKDAAKRNHHRDNHQDYEDDDHSPSRSESESESESESASQPLETPSPSDPAPATPTRKPAKPTESDKPVGPTESDKPVEPTESDEPEEPTETNQPGQQTATNQPGQQTATNQPGQQTATNRPGQQTATNRPGQPTRTQKPATQSNSPYLPSDGRNTPSATVSQDPQNIRRDAVSILVGVGIHTSAYGSVNITCARSGCTDGEAEVSYEFHNVPAGNHSFNIYEYGNIADGGAATGRYYLTAPPLRDCNPVPKRDSRAGDLGNIFVPEGATVVRGRFIKYGIFLSGDRSIIGRGIGLDVEPCDPTSDGKDRTNVVVGGIGIAQPPEGFRSSASSGAAPSSVKGGACTLSAIGSSGLTGSAAFRLVGVKETLELTVDLAAPAPAFYYAQIYTYGDLRDAATGSTLGPVNNNNIGSRAVLTRDEAASAPGAEIYKLADNYTNIDLSGSKTIVGRALGIYIYDAETNKFVIRAACPIALSGPVPDRVCQNPSAANFNQASPCIMAAKLASKDTTTVITIEDGPGFTVPPGSLIADELFIEVYEVDQEFEPPTVGKFSAIDITSSIDFQPPGDHFVANKLPTVSFPVVATKGFDLVGLISKDGVVWELLPGLKYDSVNGLTGSVPHFSYVASGQSKKQEKKDDNNDVAIGVGVGVGVGGAAIIGAASFLYYKKNRRGGSSDEDASSTPLTPQEKYGNL